MDSSLQEMVCYTLRWLKAHWRRIAMLMAGTTLGVCIYWLYFLVYIKVYIKFMFTRDPYARLWSFYVDKLVLPDSWLDIGKQILKHRDPGHRKECADDISFEEYLDHAINRHRNNHWKPIITVCNPCVFQPTYLGKMETFSRDSRFILKKAGLEHPLDGHGSKSHVEDEVRLLTDSMFRIYQHRQARLQHCLSLVDLTQRLWQAFVYNGYIDEKLTFPRQEMEV